MLRIASKSVVVAALFCGLVLAAAGALSADAGELPTAPITAPDATVASNPDATVVDLADWQQTRIIVGKTSNTVPTTSKSKGKNK
jgi:hypothetical protein